MIPALSTKTDRHQSSSPRASLISFVACLIQLEKEGIDGRQLAPFVLVGNQAVEDLVLAVLRPGLRETFHLDIGDCSTKTDLLSSPAGRPDRTGDPE